VCEAAAIGTPPWTRSEIIESIEEFLGVYADRPIADNQGGMKAPHMFATWFMVRALSPDLIVESGIWRGQGTWLLERACPTARLVSIDVDLGNRVFTSDRAVYSNRDFSEQDWSDVTDRSLVFFDDHQNAYRRLQQCRWFGFHHAIFEDNYPASQGDCYSLKKAFSCAGFEPDDSLQSSSGEGAAAQLRHMVAKLLGVSPLSLTPQYQSVTIRPNDHDSVKLRKQLDVYYEFPPVFKTGQTRWGDAWSKEKYPTPAPLLTEPTETSHDILRDEALAYTWICYARLKKVAPG